jgi:hypothetical protein
VQCLYPSADAVRHPELRAVGGKLWRLLIVIFAPTSGMWRQDMQPYAIGTIGERPLRNGVAFIERVRTSDCSPNFSRFRSMAKRSQVSSPM